MANDKEEKSIGSYSFPTLGKCSSPILIPEFQANQWEIKPSMIKMVMKNPFLGESNPYFHLTSFLELCGTFKLLDVPNEVIYLKLFPFSLMRRARKWLYGHGPHTFTSWEELANAFLLHFFPPALTKSFKKQIRFFEQDEEESFYDAYSRFKDLLHECPHHNLEKWELLHSFYDGLTPSEKDHLDSSSGGAFMELKVNKGFEMLDKIARNSYLWEDKKGSERRNREEIPREEELFCVHEDKPFETYAMTNQSSKDTFYFEDDEDAIPQDEEVSIDVEHEPLNDIVSLVKEEGMVELGCSLDETYDNELEGFEWPLEELLGCEAFGFREESFEDIEKSCNDKNVGFIWELDDLFEIENSPLHDEVLFEDVEKSCDDENVGFVWPMDELFEYEDHTLFEDVTLENDLFESWISHKQSEDLTFDYGAMEPLRRLEVTKKIPSYANGKLGGRRPQILATIVWLRGRRPQILLFIEFRPMPNGRKFQWDLKVD